MSSGKKNIFLLDSNFLWCYAVSMTIYKSKVEGSKWFRGYCQRGMKQLEYYFCFIGDPSNEKTKIAVGTLMDVPVLASAPSRFLFMLIDQVQFRKWQDDYSLIFHMNQYWQLQYEDKYAGDELTNAFNHMIFQYPALVSASRRIVYSDKKMDNNPLAGELL